MDREIVREVIEGLIYKCKLEILVIKEAIEESAGDEDRIEGLNEMLKEHEGVFIWLWEKYR